MKTLRPYQLEVVSKLKVRLKESVHPLLVTMSVGAGKSICIAEILLWLEQAGYRALCLTLNSTLIQQNANAYKGQGGHCGIYAASINSKETEPLVIFGSPQSVCNGIRNQDEISKCRFNIIIIDEAHNVDPHHSKTMYQRIINHYGSLAQTERYNYRVVGLTGTPYRGKGHSIVGEDQFFKEEICNISAGWLISEGYLTTPYFGLKSCDSYDFSKIRLNAMGKFKGSELQAVIDHNERLTGQIMHELVDIMQVHTGVFIFASTIKHCYECARSLPDGEWAIIIGETPHEERKTILERAHAGDVRYLISVSCLNVGVDVPSYDVCAWLRPTESLLLYTQGIGRVLRLNPGKKQALILDYAGNLERHGDIDDPIINEALQPKEENEKDYIIPCLECASKGIQTFNTVHARRCIGSYNGSRCSYYFTWRACESCGGRNDIAARLCVQCGGELIDPNAKLSLKASSDNKELFEVIQAKYWVLDNQFPSFHAMYQCHNGLRIYENFTIRNSRVANIFYGSFVKQCLEKPSQYYPVLNSIHHLRGMLKSIKTPYQLECVFKDNRYHIKKRVFNENSIADHTHLSA